MNLYVLYTSNKSSTDSAFSLIDGSSRYDKDNGYKQGFIKVAKIAESGTHRISVFRASDACFTRFCGLDGVEFLGCIDNDCYNCCRENPSEHFTDDDWAKVDLANARGLF